MAGRACHTPALGFVTMAEDSPTLDELRQRIADIEARKAPSRRKGAPKAKISGLHRRAALQRKTPLRSRKTIRS